MDFLTTLNATVNPQGAAEVNTLQNQQLMRGALAQISQMYPQTGTGQMMNGQAQQGGNVPAGMPAYVSALKAIANANPTAENVGAFSQTASPYFPLQMQAALQQQFANIANTQGQALHERVVSDAMGNSYFVGDQGQQIPIGKQRTYASPEAQAAHEKLDLAARLQAQLSGAKGMSQPQQSGGASMGAAGGVGMTGGGAMGGVGGSNVQNAVIPNQSPAKMAIDQVMASFRTPEQQSAITAATEEKAKNIQESAQDVINVDAASKDVLPYFDTLENLNNDPSMPHVLPEQQAEASNYLQGLKMSNGHVANLMGLWDKTNSTNLVGGIENFMAAAKGTRMDMPIAKQIFESKGIGLSGSRGGVQERISQGRNEVYNAIITAHNRALTSNDPNAPQQPLLPLSFKGRAFLMKDVQNTAQKMGVPLDKAIAQIQASGNVVIK